MVDFNYQPQLVNAGFQPSTVLYHGSKDVFFVVVVVFFFLFFFFARVSHRPIHIGHCQKRLVKFGEGNGKTLLDVFPESISQDPDQFPKLRQSDVSYDLYACQHFTKSTNNCFTL